MDIVEIIQANLLTPIILFFILGIVAARVKSDLKIPDAISSFLPIYLLAAIGLHGGIEMRASGLQNIVLPIVIAVILSIAMTLNHFLILNRIGKFNIFDSYAIAATYGSVGAVTFSVGLSFLGNQNISSEGYVAAILAVLESISLVLAIFLVNMASAKKLKEKRKYLENDSENRKDIIESNEEEINPHIDTDDKKEIGDVKLQKEGLKEILHETLAGKSIIILLGAIVIGFIIGDEGFESIKLPFEGLFEGALVIFLIEMGVIAGQRLSDIKKAGTFLIAFAVIIPTFNGMIGVIIATYIGLSIGGAVMFALLLASASFIAAPAVLRTAIPKANPSLYITSALGISFPFNIIALLPLLLIVSTILHDPSGPISLIQ